MPGDPTATRPPPQHVRIGRLGRAFQLEGGMRLRLEAADAGTPKAADRLFVIGYGPATVRAVRRPDGDPVLYLEGVRDRDSARALAGAELYAPASSAAGSAGGTFQGLIGVEVRAGDRLVGRVVDVRPARGNTLLVVDAGTRELLLPLAAPYVRVAAGAVVIVDPPAGLLTP